MLSGRAGRLDMLVLPCGKSPGLALGKS
jgi:hypothetical protein